MQYNPIITNLKVYGIILIVVGHSGIELHIKKHISKCSICSFSSLHLAFVSWTSTRILLSHMCRINLKVYMAYQLQHLQDCLLYTNLHVNVGGLLTF